MLKDTFPQLLDGHDAPVGRHIWELSRFAIETDGEQTFGFADLTMHAIHELVTFADRMSITRYVTVTTTAIERLLRRTGIEVTRLGPPVRIGVERTIALDITVDAIRAAVCKPMPVAA